MNEALIFRRARAADAARIVEIIRQAQAQMRALGSLQWQNGYPAPADIRRDIERGYGYVLEKSCAAEGDKTAPGDETAAGSGNGAAAGDGTEAGAGTEAGSQTEAGDGTKTGSVIAYGAVVFDGEKAYGAIEGAWLTGGEYVVLHRLAVADGEKGRGVAAEFMRRTETLARQRGVGSFRVDTNFDNRYMLRLLERLGFVYCGKIVYQSGERLAYEKPLEA